MLVVSKPTGILSNYDEGGNPGGGAAQGVCRMDGWPRWRFDPLAKGVGKGVCSPRGAMASYGWHRFSSSTV